jgi:hypothetical protein
LAKSFLFNVLREYFLGRAKFEHKKAYYAIYAFGVATLFHGACVYFWFISYVSRISLLRRAIKIHQEASPLKEAQTVDIASDNIKA